jgi:hypothetical protein
MTREFLVIGDKASFRRESGVTPSAARTTTAPPLRVRIMIWSIAAFAIAAFAGVSLGVDRWALARIASAPKTGATYQLASVSTRGQIVAIRFVAQATEVEIKDFLETYQASIVEPGRSGGFYRLGISHAPIAQEEFAKLVARMKQDKIIELVAVQQ